MTSQQLRQAVQAEFRRQHLILDKEALALVVDHVLQAGDGLAPVYTLIDRLDTGTVKWDCFRWLCSERESA